VVVGYGETATKKKVINLEKENADFPFIFLSIPNVISDSWEWIINVWNSLDNAVLYDIIWNLTGSCFIDPDITVDEDGDWNPEGDNVIPCNKVVLYKYNPTSNYTFARLYYSLSGKEQIKDIKVNFIDYEDVIPDKLKPIVKQIDNILSTLSKKYPDNSDIDYLKTLLVNLKNSLGVKSDTDSVVLQINEWLDENSWLLPKDLEDQIKNILKAVSDKAVKAALWESEYDQAKEEIIMFFPDNQQSQVEDIFNKIETTNPTPSQIKQYLSQILKLAKQDVENWQLEESDYNVILQDVCKILKYYNISSAKCWNNLVEVPKKVENSTGSIVWKIIKIMIIILIILFLIFVGLIIIFAIKAKREQSQQDDNNN
jgi:hypothetical protein